MDDQRRTFLEDLLATSSPSGFEVPTQRVWIDYVAEYADGIRTDEYGNVTATLDGGESPHVVVGGHADEVGYMVTKVREDGFLHIDRIGGTDWSISRGQHVTVHADDGPVNGVIGQAAIHVRDPADDGYAEVSEMTVDVGAEDEDEARDLVSVGDPITILDGHRDLAGARIAGRGLDNRVGIWVAAETLRRAAERGVGAKVCAVSTVQEEVGLSGAQMVGYDLDPDAAIAVDVAHASDHPEFPADRHNEVRLGGGPVVSRGSGNHPVLVREVRDAAAAADVDVQLQASGILTGTDADAFYTSKGGTPSLNVGVPNRYMHTPTEVVDLRDLDAAADLLVETLHRVAGMDGFSVDI